MKGTAGLKIKDFAALLAGKAFFDQCTAAKLDDEELNKHLVASLAKKHQQEIHAGGTLGVNESPYDQLRDPDYPHFAINQILHSNFLVSVGPLNAEELKNFFRSLLFLEDKTKEVKTILRLGNSTTASNSEACFHPYEEIFHQNFLYDAKVLEKNAVGNVAYYQVALTKKAWELEPEQCEQINIYHCRIADNTPFYLTPETIDFFDQVYQRSLKERVLIHCASGIGRTGMALLMFLLLKNFNQVFVEDSMTSLRNIDLLLHDIRQVRPAFIATKKQLKYAIINALILRAYHLQKTSKLDFDIFDMGDMYYKAVMARVG